MNGTSATDVDAFFRMAREFPVRTGIFTFGLPVFAFLQLLNAAVNGGSVAFVAGFAMVAVACSVLLTQYQLAVYRRNRLTRQWL